MARIRTLKPEFPQSESMGHCSRDARLLFMLTWTLCDDHGRARAASRMLASLLFPYDDDAPDLIDVWLAELEREGCIELYEIEGARYLLVRNWLKHQKIDKPSRPLFPEPREGSRVFASDSRRLVVGSRTKDQGPKDQGSKDHGSGTSSKAVVQLRKSDARADAHAAPAEQIDEQAVSTKGTRLPPGWEPTAKDAAFAELQLGPTWRENLDAFRDHWISVPRAKGFKLNWSATFRNWIREDYRRSRQNGRPPNRSQSLGAMETLLRRRLT